MKKEDSSRSSVQIGNVGGSIQNSVIAGGDARDIKIRVGDKEIRGDQPPNLADLQTLVGEAHSGLAALLLQKELIQQISPGAFYTLMGADENLKQIKELIKAEMDTARGEKVKQGLEQTTSLLVTLTTAAKTIARNANDLGREIPQLVAKIEPVIQMLVLAGTWSAKLWA